MKIFKTKKYRILSNFLKYSFVLVFVFSVALSSLLFNSFTKVVNAADPALSINTRAYSNVTTNSATLSAQLLWSNVGDPDYNEVNIPDTYLWIEYGTTQTPENGDWKGKDTKYHLGSDEKFVMYHEDILNLTPNTTYYYRVAATALGKNYFGEIENFKTLGVVENFDLGGMTVSDITQSSVKIHATKPPSSVKMIIFDIENITTPGGVSTQIVDITQSNPVVFNKLVPGTKYKITARVAMSLYTSNTITFTTLTDDTTSTPTISATSTTSNSATFSVSGLTVGQSYRLNVYTASGVLHSGWDLSRVTSSTVTTTSPSQRPLSTGSYVAKIADSTPKIVATSSSFTIAPPNTTAPTISTTSTTSNSATFSVSGLTVGASYRLNIYTSTNVLQSGWDLSRVTSTTVTTETQSQRPLSPGTYVAKLADSTPAYVATSSPFTIVPANTAVQITGFSPASGKVGDTITITGSNFVGVNNIYFGTTKGITTTNNATQITVKVPTGATSGKIKIETASNGSATSASDFTVTTANPTGTCSNGATDYPTCTPAKAGIGTDDGDGTGGFEFSGLVPKCNTGKVITTPAHDEIVDGKTISIPEKYEYEHPCDFNAVMAIINKVINFLLVTIATPLFALILIYTGWIYLSAGGSSEKVTKAKHIFTNVVIGYVIALAAFLIVKTILHTLGFADSDSLLK